MNLMLTRRYTSAELASHAGLSTATVKFFVREGVLRPSVQRAESRRRSNIFNHLDVLAAMSLNTLRLPGAAAEPFRRLIEFWQSPRGATLTESLLEELRKGASGEPRILFVTETSVVLDTTPAALMENDNAAVVYCIDAKFLVDRLNIRSVEARMLEPGPGGRAPRMNKSQKKALENLMRQSEERRPNPTHERPKNESRDKRRRRAST
jgi:hypothetical protein